MSKQRFYIERRPRKNDKSNSYVTLDGADVMAECDVKHIAEREARITRYAHLADEGKVLR